MTLDALRSAPLHRSVQGQLPMLAAGVALLAGSWLLVVLAQRGVPGWEVSVFRPVNDLPASLRAPLWAPMQLGNFWAFAVAAPLLIWIYRRPEPAVTVALGCTGAWAVAKVVKAVVERGRPADLLAGVAVREPGIHGFGYVSGHAAVAAAMLAALWPWLPASARITACALVICTGFARVYVGAHLPLDIAGGLGIGLLLGALAGLVVGSPNL